MSHDTVMCWKVRLFTFHIIQMYCCGSILFHLLHLVCAVNTVTTIQHVRLPLDISDTLIYRVQQVLAIYLLCPVGSGLLTGKFPKCLELLLSVHPNHYKPPPGCPFLHQLLQSNKFTVSFVNMSLQRICQFTHYKFNTTQCIKLMNSLIPRTSLDTMYRVK